MRGSDCVLCVICQHPSLRVQRTARLSTCSLRMSFLGSGHGGRPRTWGAQRDTGSTQGPRGRPGTRNEEPVPTGAHVLWDNNPAATFTRPLSGRAWSGWGSGPQSHLGLLLKAARGAFIFPDPFRKRFPLGERHWGHSVRAAAPQWPPGRGGGPRTEPSWTNDSRLVLPSARRCCSKAPRRQGRASRPSGLGAGSGEPVDLLPTSGERHVCSKHSRSWKRRVRLGSWVPGGEYVLRQPVWGDPEATTRFILSSTPSPSFRRGPGKGSVCRASAQHAPHGDTTRFAFNAPVYVYDYLPLVARETACPFMVLTKF